MTTSPKKTTKDTRIKSSLNKCPTMKGVEKQNVQVMIRVRPLVDREKLSGGTCVELSDGNRCLSVTQRSSRQTFRCTFDYPVLSSSSRQEDVFAKVSHCVDSAIRGYNATVFAYGQTGSGKSFTLFGKENVPLQDTPKEYEHLCGITPRAIRQIFRQISKGTVVKASFVQVYNENLYDLLLDPRMARRLKVHEEHGDIHVEGISMYTVSNARGCLGLLQVGNEHRATRETRMNQYSSRSHSVFQLTLERKEEGRRGDNVDVHTIRSKLNLVDLAGSEKFDSKNRMADGHIAELTNINLSLHTLGRCIEALTSRTKRSPGRKPYVPYRDSVLTRLLRDSLGGNTKTCLIATVSPSDMNAFETISTLKFAERAKNVSMSVTLNKVRKIDKVLVDRLEREIVHLRKRLAAKGDSVGDSSAASVATASSCSSAVEDDLFRLREENRELTRKLAGAHRPSSSGNLDGAAGVVDVNSMASDRIRALADIAESMRAACAKFFRLECEEDDLKCEINRLARSAKSLRVPVGAGVVGTRSRLSGGSAPSTLYNAAAASATRRRLPSHASSSSRHDPADFNRTSRRTTFLAQLKRSGRGGHGSVQSASSTSSCTYRITGKTSSATGKIVDPSEIRRRKRDMQLRDAERKLKRQEDMMKWAQEKAQKQLEAIDREERHRDEMRRQKEEKDRQWKEHARQQKERLKRWQADRYQNYDDGCVGGSGW
eukprot:g2364.t1